MSAKCLLVMMITNFRWSKPVSHLKCGVPLSTTFFFHIQILILFKISKLSFIKSYNKKYTENSGRKKKSRGDRKKGKK